MKRIARFRARSCWKSIFGVRYRLKQATSLGLAAHKFKSTTEIQRYRDPAPGPRSSPNSVSRCLFGGYDQIRSSRAQASNVVRTTSHRCQWQLPPLDSPQHNRRLALVRRVPGAEHDPSIENSRRGFGRIGNACRSVGHGPGASGVAPAMPPEYPGMPGMQSDARKRESYKIRQMAEKFL